MSSFSIENPYRGILPSLGQAFAPLNPEEQDRVTALADRLVEKADALFTNEEKRIEFIGTAAKILDWGVFAIVGGLQGPVLAERLIAPLHLTHMTPFTLFPGLLKVIMLPAAGFFLGIAAFEAGIEFILLRKAFCFLQSIEMRKKDPIKTLEWLKNRYFTLSPREGQKIYNYLEKSAPLLSKAEKAKRFDAIAEKAMQVNLESLERRITPGFTKEIQTELNSILRDAKTLLPWKRQVAMLKAKVLVNSLSKQAKNKILVHAIGILALTCTMVSMSIFLAGVAAGPLFIILGTIAVSLILISMILNRGIIAKEGEKVFDKLNEIAKAMPNHHPWRLAAPSPNHSSDLSA